MNDIQSVICNWCNQTSDIIWVHGHGQCSVCGTNIEKCCRGEEIQISPINKEDKKEKIDD